jgi:hypothetical protein
VAFLLDEHANLAASPHALLAAGGVIDHLKALRGLGMRPPSPPVPGRHTASNVAVGASMIEAERRSSVAVVSESSDTRDASASFEASANRAC